MPPTRCSAKLRMKSLKTSEAFRFSTSHAPWKESRSSFSTRIRIPTSLEVIGSDSTSWIHIRVSNLTGYLYSKNARQARTRCHIGGTSSLVAMRKSYSFRRRPPISLNWPRRNLFSRRSQKTQSGAPPSPTPHSPRALPLDVMTPPAPPHPCPLLQ